MQSQQGASIIAVIFLIVVVAFLGVIVVSLFVTQSTQSLSEVHSTQPLYVMMRGAGFRLMALESPFPFVAGVEGHG